MSEKNKKILFAGGGTLGSVMPLLAVFEYLKKTHPNFEFYWVGTKKGPEKKYIGKYNLPYKAISAGKLRRYFSLKNLLDIALIKIGFIQAWWYLNKLKPNIIISAGGFVSVPVVLTGKLLKIPSLIHQQDIQPGLANKIMARFATAVTVTFPEQAKDFPRNKAEVVGNPAREEIRNIKSAAKEELFKKLSKNYKLKANSPVLLVMGGGTGSKQINDLVAASLPELDKICQIIHITGQGKNKNVSRTGYSQFEFITDDLPSLLALADVVVSRAGFSSLTELSYLAKPVILIPIPNSHQEKNAEYFKSKNAVEVFNVNQNITDYIVVTFARMLLQLLEDKERQSELSQNIHRIIPQDSTEKLASEIIKILKIN